MAFQADDQQTPEEPGGAAATPPARGDDDAARGKRRTAARGGLLRAALLIAIVFIILLMIGLVPRLIAHPRLIQEARAARLSAPVAQVVNPQPAPPVESLTLPGTVDAIRQTSIYARSSGYLQRWLVDIGDRVTAGQLVAVIESPEVDQQLNQARAQLAQAVATVAQSRAAVTSTQGDLAQQQANLSHAEAQYAQAGETLAQNHAQLAQAIQAYDQQKAQVALALANLKLARVTAQRYEDLAKQGAIDQQTADQTQASYETNQSNYDSMQASLSASSANVDAYRAGVAAGEANLKAFKDSVTAAQAAVATAQANVVSSRASLAASIAGQASNQDNVAHMAVLTSYERVTAPFNGVVTARNVDTGDLINGSASAATTSVGSSGAGVSASGGAAAGSGLGGASTSTTATSSTPSGGGAGSLFSIADLDDMRVYINVPQSNAAGIRPGQAAQVTFREYPNQIFTGVITRASDAMDPASRTMVAEVDLVNRDNMLRPGMFAQVGIRVAQSQRSLLVPDSALVSDASGNHVMIVTPEETIHNQPVVVGRDYGSVFEALSGLTATDQVIIQPSTNYTEGEKVTPTTQAPAQSGGAPSPGGSGTSSH